MGLLKIGDKVKFVSGNYQGLNGTILNVDYNSNDKRAMYGYLHTVKLSNGDIGYIEKSEHYRLNNK